MKKIIFILFIFFFYKGYSQVDTTKTWYGFTQVTTLNPTDLFLIRVGGTGGVSRNIQYQYLNRFTYSSPWLYPNASTVNLALGVSTNPTSQFSGYKLYVNGNVYLSNQLTFKDLASGIVFGGTSRITENASHDLEFYSPTYGSITTLSQIMSQASGNNLFTNGLIQTTVGTTRYNKLGSPLSEHTTVSVGNYSFRFTGTSIDDFFYFNNDNITGATRYIDFNGEDYFHAYATAYDSWIKVDSIVDLTANYHSIKLGLNFMELKSAVDKDIYIRTNGGTGRVKIEDISYTQYTPQDTGIQIVGAKYLDNQDTIFRYWDGTSFVEFGSGGGTGDVSKSGTPVNGQMTGWTDDETIEGISELTYDADTLHVAKNIEADDSVFLNYIGTGAVGFLIKTETGAIDTGTLVASKISESTDYVLFDGDTLATRIYSRSVGGGTGSATPAGVTGSVQLNDGGVMGYDADLSYTGDTLKVGSFYTFDNYRTTGVGVSANHLSLKVDNSEKFDITASQIYVKNGGTNIFELGPDYFGDVSTTGGAIYDATVSSIAPTLLPRRSDNNSGIGSAAADQPSFISGGVELFRGYPDSVSFKKPIRVNALSGTTTRPAVMTSTGQLSVGDDEEILHVATLNITSINLLAGDSLQILAAPGTGKAIVPVRLCIYYDYNTSTYSAAGNSTIYTLSNSLQESIYYIDADVFAVSTDRLYWDTESFSGSANVYRSLSDVSINQPIWLNLFAHSGTGTGTAKLKLWYTIADFN